MLIKYLALPTTRVRALQRGAPDDYGLPPEHRISDGDGVPCRHCLRNVGAGEEYLVLAYRPFPKLQPYAETGPIFLHAEECARAAESDVLCEMFRPTPDFILRGYDGEDRIIYGAGGVVETHRICTRARAVATAGGRLCPHAVGAQQLLSGADRASLKKTRRS